MSSSMEPRAAPRSSSKSARAVTASAIESRAAARRANGDSRVRARPLDPLMRAATAGVATIRGVETASTAGARAGTSSLSSAAPATTAVGASPPLASSSAVAGSDAVRQPKRQLVACRIGSHTIEKCASPKKKALDPMRYMPDRAAFYVLFTVHVQSDGATDDRQVYRTYKQLGALHSRLQKKYPKSNLPKDLPTMRKKRYDTEYIEQKKQALNQYLKALLALPELRQAKTLREFFEDSRLSDDSGDDVGATNPTTRLLEGLPGTIVTVRAGQSFAVTLDLPHAGDVVSWQFTTKKHNIGFSAAFNGVSVCIYSREDSQLKPIKGYYRCTTPGVCTLNWDNTYTWSKAKVLVYWAEVETQHRRSSIVIGASPATCPMAADETAVATGTGTGGTANVSVSESDTRRSGYIESNRNHALYPRRIVNSSISLITKPFASGRSTTTTSTTTNKQQQQYKAGALIVERNLKFRGRHWYRKWFVLDLRKCVLRYYDSESAARRGLSLAKLNLNHKSAALAVTSAYDNAAPTPYLFVARVRSRNWKLCAATLREYNEWEHAISTAILTAQLSKRRPSDGDDSTGGGGATTAIAMAAGGGRDGSSSSSRSAATGNDDSGDDDDDSGDDDGDDDDDDDDDDDGEVDEDVENGTLPRLFDRRHSADTGTVSSSYVRDVLYASASCASAWPPQSKLLLLVVVNAMLLSVRALPLEAIGALLLVGNACAAWIARQLRAPRALRKAKQS